MRHSPVYSYIDAAEGILRAPRAHSPEATEPDPHWQAVISVAEYVAEHPEECWAFSLRWSDSEDEDIRMAVATCLLEHLLETHFDRFYERALAAKASSGRFATTLASCWLTIGVASRERIAALGVSLHPAQ
jgi:hypothetical protein